jgi:hypothetical protein
MKLIGKALVLGLAVGTVVAACSSSHNTTPPGTASVSTAGDQTTGQAGFALSLPGGVTITSVTYTITGPTNVPATVVQIGDAQSIEFVVGGLTAGAGYTITLTATDSNGDQCTGTGTFSITAGAVTNVAVVLSCFVAMDASIVTADVNTGSVAVDASVVFVVQDGGTIQCPGITSFSINPAEELVGSSSALGLSVVGSASVLWTESGAGAGTFSSTTVLNPTFTCTAAGLVTVTATISLPGSAACTGKPFTTISSVINCEASGSGSSSSSSGGSSSSSSSSSSGGSSSSSSGGSSSGGDAGTGDPTCAPNNGGKPCTATEELFVKKGNGCYACLVNAGCLDDSLFTSDVGHECADVPTTAPTLNSDAPNTACLNTITCILGGACANASGAGGCFCGTATGASCLTNGAPNGPCLSQEEDGLDTTDATQANKSFGNTALAAGEANAIFACAGSNSCTTCF